MIQSASFPHRSTACHFHDHLLGFLSPGNHAHERFFNHGMGIADIRLLYVSLIYLSSNTY